MCETVRLTTALLSIAPDIEISNPRCSPIFAVPLRDEAREKRILGMCPSLEEFRSSEDGLLRLCCPADSIDDIVDQSSAATGILSRCPSCLRNFMTPFCHIGCSPSECSYPKCLSSCALHTAYGRTLNDACGTFRTALAFSAGGKR